MREFLKLSQEDQKLAMEKTAARKGWVASSVEKDFWVCWSLEQLFALPELVGHGKKTDQQAVRGAALGQRRFS